MEEEGEPSDEGEEEMEEENNDETESELATACSYESPSLEVRIDVIVVEDTRNGEGPEDHCRHSLAVLEPPHQSH